MRHYRAEAQYKESQKPVETMVALATVPGVQQLCMEKTLLQDLLNTSDVESLDFLYSNTDHDDFIKAIQSHCEDDHNVEVRIKYANAITSILSDQDE